MSKVAWIVGVAVVLAVVVLGLIILSGGSSETPNTTNEKSQTLPAQSDSGTSPISDERAAESEIDSSFLDEDDDVSFGDVI